MWKCKHNNIAWVVTWHPEGNVFYVHTDNVWMRLTQRWLKATALLTLHVFTNDYSVATLFFITDCTETMITVSLNSVHSTAHKIWAYNTACWKVTPKKSIVAGEQSLVLHVLPLGLQCVLTRAPVNLWSVTEEHWTFCPRWLAWSSEASRVLTHKTGP